MLPTLQNISGVRCDRNAAAKVVDRPFFIITPGCTECTTRPFGRLFYFLLTITDWSDTRTLDGYLPSTVDDVCRVKVHSNWERILICIHKSHDHRKNHFANDPLVTLLLKKDTSAEVARKKEKKKRNLVRREQCRDLVCVLPSGLARTESASEVMNYYYNLPSSFFFTFFWAMNYSDTSVRCFSFPLLPFPFKAALTICVSYSQ